MIEEMIQSGEWLAFVFAFLIGVSMLLYAILDGFDLGVGLLSLNVEANERELMIGAIGPFWDANETWLVLGVGLLLVAFPSAHGVVLGHLYLPVAVMIIGLIFRGVSFDFRKKVAPERRAQWNRAFFWSSLVVALCQGYMVGRFVVGFEAGLFATVFAAFFGLLVVAGYLLMGACWLIFKVDGPLQLKSVRWAKWGIWSMVGCALLSSLTAPFVDTRIYDRMFGFPEVALLVVMPLASMVLTVAMHALLKVLPLERDRFAWLPFAISVSIFVFGFIGLVYSFYPYIIPGHLLIVDAAAAPESLKVILMGALAVLPILFGYTLMAHYIFRGKARELSYD